MIRNRVSFLPGVLVLATLALLPRVLAAQPAPLGPEVRVDTLFGRHPGCPQVAIGRATESFEIAWDYAGLPPFDVYLRHFAANGTPTNAGQIPAVPAGTAAVNPELEALTTISYGFRVLTRMVGATGAQPKFLRRKLDANGSPFPESPRSVGGTDTVWVWPGPGDLLYAGTYQAQQKRLVLQEIGGNGLPTGPQILVNTRPIDDPHPTLVPIGNNSEYVVVWSGLSVAQGGSQARQVIRARRFFKGMPEGRQDFDVNVTPGGAPGQAPFVGESFVVAADAVSEGFAVAWTVAAAAGTSIHLRHFDVHDAAGPEGVAVPSGAGVAPVAAAFGSSSNLLLLWRQARPEQGSELLARLFRSADGGSLGPAFPVASAASGDFSDQACGDVAWAKDHWVLTWNGQKPDSGPSGIFARRFTKGQ